MSDSEIGTAVASRETMEVGGPVGRARAAVQADDLLRLALERDGGIDVVERIVALREREQERQAEAEMAEALAAFQAACPSIKRTADSHHGKFADYGSIVRVVRPIMAVHGLTFTHDSSDDGKEVTITCTLRHVAGATRTATFTGPYDASGKKNPLQARASARSYGKRYTLSDVLGIATEEDDDGDGAGGSVEFVTESQAADLEAVAEEVGIDVPAFFAWFGVKSWDEIPAKRVKEASDAIERKRKQKAAS